MPQNGATMPKTITLSQPLVASSSCSGRESNALHSFVAAPAKYTSFDNLILARLASQANLTNSPERWSGYHIRLVWVSTSMATIVSQIESQSTMHEADHCRPRSEG